MFGSSSPNPLTPPGSRYGSSCLRGEPSTSQMPERSGLPLTRGAGAARLGFPSRVRGVAESRTFSHCAGLSSGAPKAAARIHRYRVRIEGLLSPAPFPKVYCGCAESDNLCRAPALLFSEVRAIFLVFVADAFKNVGIGEKVMGDLDGERLGIHLGVVESHFDIQVSEVPAMEALDHPQRFAVRMPGRVERRFVIETRAFDDERIALPMPDGVAQPGRERILLRERAAIGIDLAMRVAGLVEDHGQARRLDDLHRFREQIGKGNARNADAQGRGIAEGSALAHDF